MTDNKNHHYLPQFYLRNFSIPGNDRSISLCDFQPYRHIPSAPIRSQASKPYLYGKDPWYEKLLQRIESGASKIVRRVIREEQLPPELSDDAGLLTLLLGFQLGRTPAAALHAAAIGTDALRLYLRSPGVLTDQSHISFIDDLELEYTNPILVSLMSAFDTAPTLADLSVGLIVNRTALEFFASDVGAVIHNQWCEHSTLGHGLGYGSSGVQVLFPISPRHCLLFYDPDVYKFGNGRHPVVVCAVEAEIRNILTLLYSQSHERAFFTGHETTLRLLRRLSMRQRFPRHATVAAGPVSSTGKPEWQPSHTAPRLHLRLPFVAIRKAARSVPPAERANSFRQPAMFARQFLLWRERHRRPQTVAPAHDAAAGTTEPSVSTKEA